MMLFGCAVRSPALTSSSPAAHVRGELGSKPKLLLGFNFTPFARAELEARGHGAHGVHFVSGHREERDAMSLETT